MDQGDQGACCGGCTAAGRGLFWFGGGKAVKRQPAHRMSPLCQEPISSRRPDLTLLWKPKAEEAKR